MIKGKLYYNNKIHDDEIDFLIDTGSERTVLTSEDAKITGIDYDELPLYNGHIRAGDGTRIETRFLRNVGIDFFEESEGKIEHHIETCDRILVVGAKWERTLIGRDILNRFRIELDHYNDKVLLTRQLIPPPYMSD